MSYNYMVGGRGAPYVLLNMNGINMEMIKVVTWAVVGFTACPKLNSKSISGRFFLCIKIQEVKAVMQ